jgi:hypothetical protein
MKERASKWDESVLGVTDSAAYAASQMTSLEEQEVNIEFSQKNEEKEESWRDAPISKPQDKLADKKVAHKE